MTWMHKGSPEDRSEAEGRHVRLQRDQADGRLLREALRLAFEVEADLGKGLCKKAQNDWKRAQNTLTSVVMRDASALLSPEDPLYRAAREYGWTSDGQPATLTTQRVRSAVDSAGDGVVAACRRR